MVNTRKTFCRRKIQSLDVFTTQFNKKKKTSVEWSHQVHVYGPRDINTTWKAFEVSRKGNKMTNLTGCSNRNKLISNNGNPKNSKQLLYIITRVIKLNEIDKNDRVRWRSKRLMAETSRLICWTLFGRFPWLIIRVPERLPERVPVSPSSKL